MIKYLFLMGLFYVAYRMFTPSIAPPPEDDVPDDEFIDYEEVDE